MPSPRRLLFTALSLISINPSLSLAKTTALTRDVCIIGGGASGSYAAVRLQDLGYSVALIEQENQLGGHTNTYTKDDISVDYGVVDYRKNISVVEEFFDRLDIAYGDFSGAAISSMIRANLRTGKIQKNYTTPDEIGALMRYSKIAAKYPALEYGYYLPDPVPEDLLLPFGQFVVKYNVTGVIPVVFHSYGNILTQTTLYVMKYFGSNAVQNLVNGFYGTTHKNNSEIYTKAGDILGDNVFLNSHVVSSKRSGDESIDLTVKTPSGNTTIHARKLLITIPPLLSNMDVFDLDAAENNVFKQFSSVGYYTSLVTGTGIAANTTLSNADTTQPYNLMTLPGLYEIANTELPEIYQVEYGSTSPLPEEDVKSDILKSIRNLKRTGLANGTVDPRFVEFRSHTPYLLTVPADAIKEGFYKKLYSLQGHRGTFYTGAALHAHDTALLWRFTKSLVGDIVKTL
ncbi:hypothetical protein MW887_000848 [Aspergillus wentii]|nr:hypothetical protein MW887_000848 [Aspergillus wentii]